jgi:hypothetical protein
MKKGILFSISSILVFMFLTSFTGKGDKNNHTAMSSTKRHLTSKGWQCKAVANKDTTMSDSAFTKITLYFFANHYYLSVYDTMATYGRWRFNKPKSKIQMINPVGQKITIDIVSLNATNFNYSYSYPYNDTLLLSTEFRMEPISKKHKKCSEYENLPDDEDE